jgi:hypothetical protein
MELLLNLLWVAIAVSAVVARLRHPMRDRRQFRLGLGALLCVLTLLLPAISITDDLHFDTLAVEDSSSSKRLVNGAAHASPVSQTVWLWASFLTLFRGLRRTTWGVRHETFSPWLELLFPSLILGRAPPIPVA